MQHPPFADTQPAQPVLFWPARHPLPGCTGPCDQGHKVCTTPEACELPDPEPYACAMFWRCYAVAVLLVAVCAALAVLA